MARDNRSDNRRAAKAANENGGENNEASSADEVKPGIFDDLLAEEDFEEDVTDIGGGGTDDNDDTEENTDDAKAVNAKESESGEKTTTPSDVDKGKKAEADSEAAEGEKKPEGKDEAGKVAEGEKPVEKKPDGEKQPEPTSKEPTEEEKAAEAAAAAAAQQAPQNLSDEEATTLFNNWRNTTEDLLAQHHYRLTEEDVAALNENPAAWIPKFGARVYMDSISAAFQQFVTYLPRMVHQVLEQRTVIQTNEDKFFNAWPKLKAHEKGKETVLRLGAAYRKANPGATTEDFMQEVGAQAMVALRIVPDGMITVTDNQQQLSLPNFKPANGTGSEAKPPKKSTNPFDLMAEEFSMEEDAPND